MKHFLLFLLLCLCTGLAIAQPASDHIDATGSPYFQVDVEGAKFPLKSTAAEVNISGVIADVVVTQTYVNDGEHRLEATYVFPGSTSSAVYGMTMIIGNRRIKGDVQRKQEARETYEKAKSEGKRASLLEQHRPNVFQMNVANIVPGDTVQVELRYTELLVPTAGTYSFTYPTVVGPRYVNGSEEQGGSFSAQAYTISDEPTYDFDLNVYLNAGVPIAMVGSPSHKLATTRQGAATRIELDGSENKGGNRDFVLEYNLQGDAIQTGMLTYEGEDANYFLYMAQPPVQTTKEDYPPREFIFVVDVSGSMTGWPLDVSKRLLKNLTAELRPVDEFNILLFAGRGATWKPASVRATPENLAAANAFLSHAEGGGGTELLNALEIAYDLPRSRTGLSRNIVIATDGYVYVEPEAFSLIRSRLSDGNVYSFGIGSGVNRHLIEGMARVGQGRPAYVLNESESSEESDRFQRYISQPVLTEIELSFSDKFDAYDVEPISIPDLSTERPLIVFGKYRGKAKGQLVLSGYGGYKGVDDRGVASNGGGVGDAEARRQRFSFNLKNAQRSERHAGLEQLWARERIRQLSDFNSLSNDKQIVEEVTLLGLEYNLLTEYTSFVAVEEVIVADPQDSLMLVNQPLPLPQNVSATAVGFDLGLMGVVGLPSEGGGLHWGWYALVGLTLILIIWRFKTKKGWPEFGGLGSPRDLVPVTILLALSTMLFTCDRAPITQATTTEAAYPNNQHFLAQDRRITFILGEDEGTNAYYSRATEYFRWNPEEAGETVVTDLRSLAEVRNYLARTQVKDGWEKINVVAHGNQWTGLATKLDPASQSERVNSNMLASWNPGRPLPDNVVNENTEIIVHGCSVGRDTALLLQLSRVFAGNEQRYPTVSASQDFTLFRQGAEGMERHYADYVYRARPLGNYPLPKVMATRLRRQYPDKQIDWDEALSNSRFTEELQPHLYQFNVPVQWTRVYPEAEQATAPTGKAAENNWLAGEQQLISTLDRMGLRPHDFLWNFQAGQYPLADGSQLPAITAAGTARLFCVLIPRAETEPTTMASLRWSNS